MKRSICIWLGFAVLLALTTFPPWIESQLYPNEPQGVVARLWHARADRAPIIDSHLRFSVDVDYRRMWTEIAVGECFVLALFLTWGRTRFGRDSK